MDNTNILEKIGLNKHESAIYLALLELGPSILTKISDKTAIHRPLVYKAIPSLLEKKLITETQVKKHLVYTAEPPNRLEAIFEDLKYELFNILPDLEDKYVMNTKKLKVRFLEGKEGTKRIFDDVVRSLPRRSTFYRFTSNKDGVEKRDNYFPRSYRNIRDAKKLERQVITNKQTSLKKETKIDRFVKIMPEDFGLFDYNVTELIYGDKVAFIDYNSDTAVVIENKQIANLQKNIFQILYKKL